MINVMLIIISSPNILYALFHFFHHFMMKLFSNDHRLLLNFFLQFSKSNKRRTSWQRKAEQQYVQNFSCG